ncbi:MAG TPA: desulfoferrodoxin family protein [Bacilli bacterium]|nr:desulfoferrodoxin family protein [Bacilli bacterium]
MKYYLCEICGNLVELVEEGGGELVCCGQPMKELIPKTTEEGNEKHLPIMEINGNKVIVKVGSVPHPMTSEHYIKWIVILYNGKCQRTKLTPESKPEAIFEIENNVTDIKAYAYCNVHGLWVSK